MEPPKLKLDTKGQPTTDSLADLLEFFLNNDQRVNIVRHPQVEELFQWKQEFDRANGTPAYPFENAEARFAVGVIQAIQENDTKDKLHEWITRVLEALGESKQTNEDMARSFGLDQSESHITQAQKLTSEIEKRLYLTSCWIESLCTAEVRFLGWVYQELYGEGYQPPQ
ncbi:MAG: hypothetical protein R2684_14425 [Pyrinomonadaceae bacterium]